jgi:uncharacterized protein YbjT (DUF2867 family)
MSEEIDPALGTLALANARTDRRGFLSGLALGVGGALASLGLPTPARAGAAPRKRVLVTAPTSSIGQKVLRQLVDSGAHVRVIARDPSRIATDLRRQVEIVQGSHGDARTVDIAFEEVDSIFWLCPPDPQAPSVNAAYVDFARPACRAIGRGGVRRIVGISALGRGSPLAADAGYVTASLEMDDLIASTGVAFRALTLPSFMENLVRQANPIRDQGSFFLPFEGDLKLPTIASRDIATVAAGLLLDPSWHGQEEVPLLGPEDLSFNEMAGIMSEELDMPVKYQQISFEAYQAGFVQRGMSAAMAQGMADMARAKSGGLDSVIARTAANSTPTSFRIWCDEELRPAVRG